MWKTARVERKDKNDDEDQLQPASGETSSYIAVRVRLQTTAGFGGGSGGTEIK